jgi:cellulose synthase/poly-beta-1,6-N-acetylglucosamine synthase-like glycosyltransferase
VGAMNEMHLDGNENIDEFLTIIESKGFTVWKIPSIGLVFLRYEVSCNLSVLFITRTKLKKSVVSFEPTYMSNKVSVIVPVYNQALYLDETLQSVLEQTHLVEMYYN